MKNLLIGVCLILISPSLQSQSIEFLESRIKYFEGIIANSNDSIKALKNSINDKRKLIKIDSIPKTYNLKTKVKDGWYSKISPAYDSKRVRLYKTGEEITVIGYYAGNMGDYYVSISEKEYLDDIYIVITDSLFALKQVIVANEKNKKEVEKVRFEKAVKQEEKERKNYLIAKYGSVNGSKLYEGKIWLGMTDKMLIEVMGKPEDINRTVGSFGVHEQWVYGSIEKMELYYFENGKLVSWQD